MPLSAPRGGFHVELAGRGGDGIEARRVLLAVPADASASLLRDSDPESVPLADVPYAPVAVVCLGFRRSAVRHPLDGFGFLAPPVERRRILGCLFPSSIFPDRAPEDCVTLSVFAGGALSPDVARLPDDALKALALEEIDSLLGLDAEPIIAHVERWPRAIPQYVAGHGSHLERVARLEARHPGLRFCGNWLNGVSIGDCARGAVAVARELAADRLVLQRPV
jgi:oxygen-dependent protoporphyrinogen oxidase